MNLFETMFSRGPLPALEKTLQFSEARHKYLLNNIANADTPNYRRTDLSAKAFDRELERAVQTQRKTGKFRFDEHDGVREERALSPRMRLLDDLDHRTLEGVMKHDRNNIDIEREMATLVKNSGRGKRAAKLLTKLMSQISAAVSSGR